MLIWKYENKWPRDFESFIFLARAVRLVGRAAFPDEWSDSDPLQEPQPDFRGKTAEAHQRRHTFIRRLLMDDSKEWQVPLQFPVRPPGSNLSIEEWRVRGAQLLREHKVRTDAARDRCRQAEQMLLDWLIAGEVTAAYRPHEGGALERLPNTYWNSENVISRFRTGKLNINYPFKPIGDIGDESSAWIFINVTELTRQLHSDSPPTLRRSTLLQFTMDFSDENFEYFFEKGRTQKEISRKAQEVWLKNHNTPLPHNVSDAIAIIVRELEHGRGKWSGVHSRREPRQSDQRSIKG